MTLPFAVVALYGGLRYRADLHVEGAQQPRPVHRRMVIGMNPFLSLAHRAARLLRSSKGAFDMMSVLVGAAVIAILVGGTMTNAFGVIPWVQDNGARQNLSAVSNAQGVAKVRDGRFLDNTGLADASYLSGPSSLAVGADANGSCWVGLAKSDTGKVFYSTSDKADPQPFASGTNPGCVARTDLRMLAVAVGAPLPIAKAAIWGSSITGSGGSTVPVDILSSGILAGKHVTDVAGGQSHSCLVADSKAYCWGFNSYGQLGTGTTTTATSPTAVEGVLAGKSVTDVAVSERATCAVADGEAYCWGDNSKGQLGTGDTTARLSPAAVSSSGVLSGKVVKSISIGRYHSCAVVDEAGACWGENMYGKLGDGSGTDSLIPVAILTTGSIAGRTISEISSGLDHSCAVAGGRAYCWGLSGDGQLGVGSTGYTTGPRTVDTSGVLSGKVVTKISTGNAHSCAVADGAVFCWGTNTNGQVGTGDNLKYNAPAAVVGVLAGKSVTSVEAGYSSTCAISEGSAYCWGANGGGQHGTGDTVARTTPVAVSTAGVLSGKFVLGVSLGAFHALAFYE